MTSMVFFARLTREVNGIPEGTIAILDDHPSRCHRNTGLAIPFNGRVHVIFTDGWEPLTAPNDPRPVRIAIEGVTPRQSARLG